MYQALYRKWRPQTFDQVIGQEHITQTLKNQVKTGRLSHAYIFIGTRGTGKTTCARILAKAVNCEHPVDGNPCGVCHACRGINDGSILDVVELDAASNSGVDNVRALREEGLFTPAAVKKRVYIIDEVHSLTPPAFNALLKILEEPPEHLMFILATTELHKVPATILSRCQRHSFRRIGTEQLAKYLEEIAQNEGLKLTGGAAEIIARLAEGGVRDALSLLDQCSASDTIDPEAVYSAMGLAGNMRIAAMLDSILRHDSAAAMESFNKMWMDGKDPSAFLGELSSLMRDALMMHVAPNSGAALISGGYDTRTLGSFAKRMTSEELLAALSTVQNTLAGMRNVRNPKTAAELCLISLCGSAAGDSTAELRARISRLEQQMKDGVRNTADSPHEPAPAEEKPREPDVRREPERDTPPWEEETGFSGEEPERVPWADEDPESYYEEQPEDVLLRNAGGEPEPESPEERPRQDVGDLWQAVCRAAESSLPGDIRAILSDPERMTGRLEGELLKIEVMPGFIYGRVNRPEITAVFAEAAEKQAGRPVRVLVSEIKSGQRPQRSLEELKQFSEVRFL